MAEVLGFIIGVLLGWFVLVPLLKKLIKIKED